MCPRSNHKDTQSKYTPLPINLSLNLHLDQIDSINSSELNVNDHRLIDHFLDTLQPNSNQISQSTTDSTITVVNNSTNAHFGIEMPVDILSALFTGSVLSGGIIGYASKGSKPSLIAGLAFGTLLGVGTYLTSIDPNNCYLTLGTSTVLAGVMGKRFMSSGKFMPPGLIASLSTLMILRCVYQMTIKGGDKDITQ